MPPKKKRGAPKRNADNMTEIFQVRCTPEDFERWKDAARELGLPLGSWVRMTLLKSGTEDNNAIRCIECGKRWTPVEGTL